MKTAYLEHKQKENLILMLSLDLKVYQDNYTVVSSTHFYDEISESYKAVIFYYD